MSIAKKLQKWVDNDLITNEQSAKIKDFEQKNNSNLFFKISFLIVGFLIGWGICLIVASNWDEIPVMFRLVADFGLFAVFIAGAYQQLQKPESKFREMMLFLCFTMVAASIGLIGQIFNLEGGWHSFAISWALLSLPYVACSRSRAFNVAWVALFLQGLCSGYFINWLVSIFPWLLFFDLYRYQEHIIPATVCAVSLLLLINFAAKRVDSYVHKYTLIADAVAILSMFSAYFTMFLCGLYYMGTSRYAAFALMAHLLVLAFLAFRMFCAVREQDIVAFRRNALIAEIYIFLIFASSFGSLFITGIGFIFGGLLLWALIYCLKKTSRFIKGMEIFNG